MGGEGGGLAEGDGVCVCGGGGGSGIIDACIAMV